MARIPYFADLCGPVNGGWILRGILSKWSIAAARANECKWQILMTIIPCLRLTSHLSHLPPGNIAHFARKRTGLAVSVASCSKNRVLESPNGVILPCITPAENRHLNTSGGIIYLHERYGENSAGDWGLLLTPPASTLLRSGGCSQSDPNTNFESSCSAVFFPEQRIGSFWAHR
jgi:hypothetical protein